jgi:hypothetical protein
VSTRADPTHSHLLVCPSFVLHPPPILSAVIDALDSATPSSWRRHVQVISVRFADTFTQVIALTFSFFFFFFFFSFHFFFDQTFFCPCCRTRPTANSTPVFLFKKVKGRLPNVRTCLHNIYKLHAFCSLFPSHLVLASPNQTFLLLQKSVMINKKSSKLRIVLDIEYEACKHEAFAKSRFWTRLKVQSLPQFGSVG